MRELTTKGASQPIIVGLQARGFSLATVQRAAGISAANLIAVMDGRREFTDVQLQRLESMSGLTAGQLGATALEPEGGPLTRLVDELASARRTIGLRRPAKRRNRKPTALSASSR